jgi:hypothetical protein
MYGRQSRTASRLFHLINLFYRNGDINTRSSRLSNTAIHPMQPPNLNPYKAERLLTSNHTLDAAAYAILHGKACRPWNPASQNHFHGNVRLAI